MPILVSVLDVDPAFLDPVNGDYRLGAASPCIDAGDPAFVAPTNAADLENQPRINNGRVDIGSDEHWAGLTLGLAWPARAGEVNTVTLDGATPGELVHFFSGTAEGTFALPFGNCPTLALDIADPLLLSVAIADSQGQARHVQFVLPIISGQVILTQAVTFDPGNPFNGCDVSNLVAILYQ